MTGEGTLLAGKYRLGRLVGAGGMGGVFEAVNEQIGKPVAVKLLRPEFAFDGEMVQRFMREARAAAAIGHPCIVDVYDVGAAPDGSLFMVMELLKGESLAHVLERQATIAPGLVTYAACQVLSALDAAHKRDVVHRDIKPGNIILVERGQALPDVKLLDFGVSKVLDPSKPGERLTKTGVPVGTPSFMAPEQVLGERDVDRRADVYAVGVLLYRCLTGQLPFRPDENEGVYYKILKGNFAPPRAVRPDIPPAYEQVILRAMAPKREARYQSAAELLTALMVFLDERSADRVVLPEGVPRLSAAPGLLGSSPPPTADRSGAFSAGTSGAFPAVGRGAAVSGAYAAYGTPSSAPARKRSRALPIAVAVGAIAVVALAVTFVALRPWARRGRADEPVTAAVVTAPASPPPAPPPVADALPPPPVGAPAPTLPPPAAPTVAGTLELRVQVEPPESTVYVDGVAVVGNPYVGAHPRDGSSHVISAAAEGYEERSQVVRFDRDIAISLVLARLQGSRGGRPRGAGSPDTLLGPPPAPLPARLPSPFTNQPSRTPLPGGEDQPGLADNPFGR